MKWSPQFSSASLILALGLALAGCGQGTSSTQGKQAEQSKSTDAKGSTIIASAPSKTQIEVMPEESEESTRIHKFNEFGVEVETQIRYRDGSEGFEKRNALNRTVSQAVRYFRGGKDIKSSVKYSQDGKTILMEQIYSSPGKLESSKEKLSDGSYKVVENYASGIPRSITLLQSDGSGSQVLYDEDSDGSGKILRMKTEWTALKQITIEEFDYSGVLETRSQIGSDGALLMHFFKDGKVILTEQFQARSGEDLERAREHFMGLWELKSAQSFEDDSGKLTRELFFDSLSQQMIKAIHHRDDGKTEVIEFDADSKPTVHRVINADGSLDEELDLEDYDSKLTDSPDGFIASPSFELKDMAQSVKEQFLKQQQQ